MKAEDSQAVSFKRSVGLNVLQMVATVLLAVWSGGWRASAVVSDQSKNLSVLQTKHDDLQKTVDDDFETLHSDMKDGFDQVRNDIRDLRQTQNSEGKHDR